MKGFMKIFNNTYFLYFIVFLAITNVLGYLVTNKYNAILFFAIVSLLTYQFNKNMAIVLLVALLTTNLLMINGNIREGLEVKEEEEEEEEDDKLEIIDPELKKGLDILKKTDDVEQAKEILDEPEGITKLTNAASLEEAYSSISKLEKQVKELINGNKIIDTMKNMKQDEDIEGFGFENLTSISGTATAL
jgi:hypothetical protein